MNEFAMGWKIVLTAMLGIAFSASNILLYTIGAIAPELSQEFGWSHGAIQLSSLFSIGTIVISLPIVGYLSDKFGVRLITIVAIITSSACIMLHAFLPDNIIIFYMLACLTALSFVGVLPLTWTKMVTSWFDKHLGLALGLTLLGTGLGGALLKPSVAGLISEFGWRGAYVGLAAIPLVLVLPLVLMWFKEPEKISRTSNTQVEGKASTATSIPFVTALKDWRFWAIAVAYMPIGFAVAGLITNMEVILASGGATPSDIVTAGATFGLSVIVGRIIGGYLLDKFNPGIVGFVLIMSLSLGLLILSGENLSMPMVLLAIALAGFGTGVEFDVLSYVINRIFGWEHYAKIFGAIMVILYIGSAFGPMLFGSSYDKYGNFDPVLVPAAIGIFVSSILIGSLSGSLKKQPEPMVK